MKVVKIVCLNGGQSNLEFEEFRKNVMAGKEVLYRGCYRHKKPNPNCNECLELNYAKLYCNVCKRHERIKSFRVLPTHIEYVCVKGHLNKRVGDRFLKVGGC